MNSPTNFTTHARRRSWCVAVILTLLGATFLSLSCGQVNRRGKDDAPKAELLSGGELSVVMSRLGAYPRRVVTSAEKIPVRLSFDPTLVDFTTVDKVCLWTLDPATSIWRKVAEAPLASQPINLEVREGLIGLRGSVVCKDGQKRLVPLPGEDPALWLCVDRTPPALVWVSPRDSALISGMQSLDLEWSSSDTQFGRDPMRLEWSANRGKTWKPIASVTGEGGRQSYRWTLPEDVCSDIQVRVVARDLTGQEGTAVLALRYPGSVKGDSQLAEAEKPGTSGKDEKVSTSQGGGGEPAVEGGKEPADRVAHPAAAGGAAAASAAAGSGVAKSPQQTEGAATPSPDRGPLELVPLKADCLRGGEKLTVAWKYRGTPPDVPATVEWSRDGGQTWNAVGSAPLAQGSIEWSVPRESGTEYQLRIAARSKSGWQLESRLESSFSVDSEPPRLAVGDLPPRVGAEVSLPVALSDPGGAGVERVDAYVREQGREEWTRLDAGKVKLEGLNLQLDLSDFQSGPLEIALRAYDRVGNASPSPLTDSAPAVAEGDGASGMASRLQVDLDREPPEIKVSKGPRAWVSGFPAEAEVHVDLADAVPPLILEGSTGGEDWREIARFSDLSPDQVRFSFDIPGNTRAYAVRFCIADATGNKGVATIGPERVRTPIRLKSFLDGRARAGGELEAVEWELDPVAESSRVPLLVSVAQARGGGGDWEQVCEVSAGTRYEWELPEGDGSECRVRIRLLRKDNGKTLGEDVSPPFVIRGSGGSAVAVAISEDSLEYSGQAAKKMDQYFRLLSSGEQAVDSAELERLRGIVTTSYAKALEIDEKNYNATYGMAQFLNREDPVKNATEVREWLEKTIEIKPDHVWALNDLGAVCIRDGNFEEAEGYLIRSASAKDSAVILYNLGLARYYGHKPAKARETLQKALAAAKDGRGEISEGEVAYYMIQSYVAEGNTDAARKLLKEKESVVPEALRADLAQSLK